MPPEEKTIMNEYGTLAITNNEKYISELKKTGTEAELFSSFFDKNFLTIAVTSDLEKIIAVFHTYLIEKGCKILEEISGCTRLKFEYYVCRHNELLITTPDFKYAAVIAPVTLKK